MDVYQQNGISTVRLKIWKKKGKVLLANLSLKKVKHISSKFGSRTRAEYIPQGCHTHPDEQLRAVSEGAMVFGFPSRARPSNARVHRN